MKKLGFYKSLDLKPVVPTNVATHVDGKQLDQIWTSLEVANSEIVKRDVSPTDHFVITAKFILKGASGAQKFTQKDANSTTQEMRNVFKNDEIVD